MICIHPATAKSPANMALLRQAMPAALVDRLQSARASEYRRALVHDANFAAHIFADLQNVEVLHALMAIAEVDSCAAGGLLAELFDAYAKQMAKNMARDDGGVLFEMPAQQPLDFYVQRVEAAITTLRGNGNGAA